MSRFGSAAAVASVLCAVASVAVWRTDPTAQPADGVALFTAKGCSGCHEGPGSPTGVGGVPSLLDASSWAGDRRPAFTAADYLAESIRDPGAFRAPAFTGAGPVTEMPEIELSDDEIAALVDFLLQG